MTIDPASDGEVEARGDLLATLERHLTTVQQALESAAATMDTQAATIASLQSQVEAMRAALEFSGRVMRSRPERSVADNLALAKTDAALAAVGQKETDHG